jgi:AAA+ ATPase superfamily predicted ATPase
MKAMFKTKPFVNRRKELTFFQKYFASIPDSIFFFYGPKSCGKSSLIRKVIEDMNMDEYAINHISLRSVIIYDFRSFLNVFFPEGFKSKFADIVSGITFNAGFFSIGVDDESFLKENPFGVMEKKLFQAKKRGIQPIIIIDEIQELKNIYMNGERYLIDELFNFFIELTKVKHLAHVVCATSDSYFIEELYQSSKLAKTSKFQKLDHFDRVTTFDWLKEEGVSEEEAEIIWDQLGGSPWEIWQVLEEHRQGDGSIEQLSKKYVKKQEGKVEDFRDSLFGKSNAEKVISVFDAVSHEIHQKGMYQRKRAEEKTILTALLKQCIEKDIWFFDSDQRKITANSRSVELALGRI